MCDFYDKPLNVDYYPFFLRNLGGGFPHHHFSKHYFVMVKFTRLCSGVRILRLLGEALSAHGMGDGVRSSKWNG